MRLRLALAAALPALLSLAAMALLGDRLARRALEEELGARLVAVAQAAVAGLDAERVSALGPGDEDTRTYGHVRARLAALGRATSTRLTVVGPDLTALADSEGLRRIGEPLPALERDRFELGQVLGGRAVASEVLFRGSDGELYKTGYAPLADGAGRVRALVAVDGTAPSFATLRRFRSLLLALSVAGAVLGAAASVAAALALTRPMRTLAAAARRIGQGDLETALVPARRAPGEIEALRRTLEEMRQALRSRDREREAMLAGIAHEVRNPLGAMELFAAALAADLEGRPEAAHLSRIRSELASLERLVADFLDYARPRALALEELDLAPFAGEVGELALPLAQSRGVELRAEGGGRFCGDREALRRALLNLVHNAIEASAENGLVEVSGQSAGGEAVLEVRDRGPGLNGVVRERLGEPFVTTKERGTGLGLALARKAALAHGGRLELLPREGGGTVARVTLPARPAATMRASPEPAYNPQP